jgi:hypothetical protein
MSAESAVRMASSAILISSAINVEPFDFRAAATCFREPASTEGLIRHLKSAAGGMMVIELPEPYIVASIPHNEKRTFREQTSRPRLSP